MNINGKLIAEDIYDELAHDWRMQRARLCIVVMKPSAAIESFVRIKTRAAEKLGVQLIRIDVPADADTAAVVAAVARGVGESDAVIVQLPLPEHVDTEAVLAAVPATHDVDAINPTIPDEARIVRAPVAMAAWEVLNRSAVVLRGARVVVAGNGRLVGAPVAALLRELGASVSVVTLSSGSLEELKEADIVVLGMGVPHSVTPDMIKEGAVVIDAGTSDAPAGTGGSIVGDADPACAEKAAVCTPVPGGIGPIAVAMIFSNLLRLIAQ